MKLNKYLYLKLGVRFEDKYNKLAIIEILRNKENYPLIHNYFYYMVESSKDAKLSNINCDFNYSDFARDGIFEEYKAIIELYDAFINVFSASLEGKNIKVNFVSFGVAYLKDSKVSMSLDYPLNYVGASHIDVTKSKITFTKSVFSSNVEYASSFMEKTNFVTVHKNNQELLEKINKGIDVIISLSQQSKQCFDDDWLLKHKKMSNKNLPGYRFDTYSISIGKNLIKIFTLERGFDLLVPIRMKIDEHLSAEEKQLEVVKEIYNPF